MNAHSALEDFEKLIADSGKERQSLTVGEGIRLMIAFYRETPAEDCPVEADGDMLLYQWGTHDWGEGEFFELDLRRQFILGGDSEDENIWHLSLTFKFRPDERLKELGSGNKWCDSRKPRALDYFQQFIEGTAAYQEAVTRSPELVELDYQCAG